MAHRPLSTTKDRTGPLDRTGEYGKTTQFEEFPCTCEELTRHAESSVQKNVCHRLSHRCKHLRDFAHAAHAHLYNNWNSKFRMSISNTPHDQIGARNMILQNKQ